MASEFKFTNNQLTIVPLTILPTTSADPNRVVITDQNGYMMASDITLQDLTDAVTNTLVYTNGITKSGQDIKLGGSLIENTVVNSPTNKTFQIISGSTLSKGSMKIDPFATYTVRLEYSDSNFSNTHTYGIGLGGHGMFYGGAGSSYFTIQDTVVSAGADFPTHNSLFIVADALRSRGIEYGGDYEANFVARSLVTKRYVDNAVASGGFVTLNTTQTITGTKTFTTTTTAQNSAFRVTNNVGQEIVLIDQNFVTVKNPTNTFYAQVGAGVYDSWDVLNSKNARLYYDRLEWGRNSFNSFLQPPATLTASRTWTLPDVSGTVELAVTEIAIPSTVIDFLAAKQQYQDILSNTTYTFSNSSAGKSVQVFITNTSGGTVTVGFTGDVEPSGADYTIAAGKTKVFSFACSRSSIYGAVINY